MPLNRNERVKLRQLLEQRQHQLDDALANEKAGHNRIQSSLAQDGVMDDGDESVALVEVETHLAILTRHSTELQGLERAYLRLRTDDYGQCSVCGEEIGFRRLQANPLAERCLRCQEDYEHSSLA